MWPHLEQTKVKTKKSENSTTVEENLTHRIVTPSGVPETLSPSPEKEKESRKLEKNDSPHHVKKKPRLINDSKSEESVSEERSDKKNQETD